MVYAKTRIRPRKWNPQISRILKYKTVLIKKKENLSSSWFFWSSGPQSERMQKDWKILVFGQRAEKAVEYEGDDNSNYSWWAYLKSPRKDTDGIGNQRKNWDYTGENIVKIGLIIQKNPGDVRRFAVTQTPGKNSQEMKL